MFGTSAHEPFRRRGFTWSIDTGGRSRALLVRVRSDEVSVYLDSTQVASGPLPTPEHRWLSLSVPSTDRELAVAVVRYPNRRYRAAAFVDGVNVDDGSRQADWGEHRFPEMDRFEDNFLDSPATQLPAALLLAAAFFYFFITRRATTPAGAVVGGALAAGVAAWVLLCGRVVVPYLASQRTWPVAFRNLAWAGILAVGLASAILAALAAIAALGAAG